MVYKMIITRTPYRISFFGGGTDYPSWYKDYGGSVISTTIDKYCFISCRLLPKFFDHNFRIVYSRIEDAYEVKDIIHPSVREVLLFKKITEGLEIHHDGDLPARSGLGSSSAFTVGLIHAIESLNHRLISKKQLALDALKIEQNIIKENVGSQDQIATAYGGFNNINFNEDETFSVNPILIDVERKKFLNRHLMLFFTGTTRIASEIAVDQLSNMKTKVEEHKNIFELVSEGLFILNDTRTPITEFGKLLDRAWRIKKQLSNKISNSFIDNIYETALSHGALGGKLLGAGGGGFILLFVSPEKQNKVKNALHNLVHVPFKFESQGSSTVLYEPDGL